MENYIQIIDSKISDFALRNNAIKTDFQKYKKDDVDYCSVDFGVFKAFFVAGSLSYGYSFFEGSDISLQNGVIVRLKFDFSPVYFSPYDIHNAVELKDFKILDFHYLPDEQILNEACDRLFSFINENRYHLEEIARSPMLQQTLLECFEKDLKQTSKRLYKKGIQSLTEKDLRSHEIDMYFHNTLSVDFSNFVNDKSPRALQKELEKQNKKDKLLVFEKRYYEYLKAHDFAQPESFTKQVGVNSTKTQNAAAKITTISGVICIIISHLFFYGISKAYELTHLKDYLCIQKAGIGFPFIPAVLIGIALSVVLDYYLEKKYFSKKNGTTFFQKLNKKNIAILLVACVVIGAFGVIYELKFGVSYIALGENDICYVDGISNTQSLPYKNDVVKLSIVDGYIDDEDNTFYEEEDIIIVINDDYEDNSYSNLYDEKLENAINMLEKNYPNVEHYKTYEDFCTAHNLEY